jgi:hypothetical protein
MCPYPLFLPSCGRDLTNFFLWGDGLHSNYCKRLDIALWVYGALETSHLKPPTTTSVQVGGVPFISTLDWCKILKWKEMVQINGRQLGWIVTIHLIIKILALPWVPSLQHNSRLHYLLPHPPQQLQWGWRGHPPPKKTYSYLPTTSWLKKYVMGSAWHNVNCVSAKSSHCQSRHLWSWITRFWKTSSKEVSRERGIHTNPSWTIVDLLQDIINVHSWWTGMAGSGTHKHTLHTYIVISTSYSDHTRRLARWLNCWTELHCCALFMPPHFGCMHAWIINVCCCATMCCFYVPIPSMHVVQNRCSLHSMISSDLCQINEMKFVRVMNLC